MKRFIISVLSVTVFCVGLGALVERVGARFKSDEKAIALIKQSRIAIGGDQSIAQVRSMIIKGSTTNTFKMGDETRTEQGETEIAMQLPDKLSKMVKIGRPDGAGAEHKIMSDRHDVVIMHGEGHGEGAGVGPGERKKVIVRNNSGDGKVVEKEVIVEGNNGEFITKDGKKVIVRTVSPEGKNGEFVSADGKKFDVRIENGPEVEKVIVHGGGEGNHMKMAMGHHGARQNELLQTTLSLLLSSPEGMDVTYTFVGEGDVDGAACNIVNASFGGSNIKLYLSKASSLPVMVSYQGHPMPKIFVRTKAPEGAAPEKGNVMFTHKIEGPAEMAEYNVRFSDYRGVGGVQLPYKWTTTIAGQPSEVFDVTGYEINPANIADKFQNQKTFVRTKKETN